jgi:hypothetical protein
MNPQPPPPTAEHTWLRKLLGNWTYEHPMTAPDGREQTFRGTETFQAVGNYWVQGRAEGAGMDGGPSAAIMTLGFDPAKARFVGSWIGSMMPIIWVYDGELDPGGKILRLYADGPAFDGSNRIEPYMDVVEFIDDDYRTLSGHTKNAEGVWTPFMTGHYRRVK